MSHIEIKNIYKYFDHNEVLKGITLNIDKGEILTLLGSSGAGKSLLLRSIIGLETIDQGEILYKGESIANLNEDQYIEIRKNIAYLFQGGALFDSLTVKENLAYPLREHTTLSENEIVEKIHDKLELLGLSGTENLLPASLSGGMRKRVGFARAIILEPDVILYDEPTSGLDPFNTKKIDEVILNLKRKGITSILITHDMKSAFEITDRIAMIHRGQIIAEGFKNDVINNKTVYNFIHGLEPEDILY